MSEEVNVSEPDLVALATTKKKRRKRKKETKKRAQRVKKVKKDVIDSIDSVDSVDSDDEIINPICNSSMTMEACELTVLRAAVDEQSNRGATDAAQSGDVKRMMDIVEEFLRSRHCICYGGTAINNILPKKDQFYDYDVEIPDYDFFSPSALDHAKELADIYVAQGFGDVQAQSGIHTGTYKVFVEFIPVADITSLPKDLFDSIERDAIRIRGINYAPPNYLRMSMYKELSHPSGDVSRWEKVHDRLQRLNRNFPLHGNNCGTVNFQRNVGLLSLKDGAKVFDIIRDTFIDQGVVFFGGYAVTLYSQYMPKNQQKQIKQIPDFDVISDDPEALIRILQDRFTTAGIKGMSVIKHDAVADIIKEHHEVRIGPDTVAFIYMPLGCQSYNILEVGTEEVKVATIDTILNFYLAFLYSPRPYYQMFTDRLLCMSEFLFEVEQHNRLAQTGLLKRFPLTCYGHELTVAEVRAEKAAKFRELSVDREGEEFKKWFFSYRPSDLALKAKKSSMSMQPRQPRQQQMQQQMQPRQRMLQTRKIEGPRQRQRQRIQFGPKWKTRKYRRNYNYYTTRTIRRRFPKLRHNSQFKNYNWRKPY